MKFRIIEKYDESLDNCLVNQGLMWQIYTLLFFYARKNQKY